MARIHLMPCLCNIERSQINIRQNINSPGHVFYPLTMKKFNTLLDNSYFFGEGLSHIITVPIVLKLWVFSLCIRIYFVGITFEDFEGDLRSTKEVYKAVSSYVFLWVKTRFSLCSDMILKTEYICVKIYPEIDFIKHYNYSYCHNLRHHEYY